MILKICVNIFRMLYADFLLGGHVRVMCLYSDVIPGSCVCIGMSCCDVITESCVCVLDVMLSCHYRVTYLCFGFIPRSGESEWEVWCKSRLALHNFPLSGCYFIAREEKLNKHRVCTKCV